MISPLPILFAVSAALNLLLFALFAFAVRAWRRERRRLTHCEEGHLLDCYCEECERG